jgi:histidine ammonia-lyase
VANVADLLDRQLALLVDEKYNRGLPPNLSGSGGDYSLSHGFKAVQIGASAWTAEALKTTMPASVFSRSTECHNQDKVSMGTIAARDCVRALELTEQVAAALLLADTQALRLRLSAGETAEGALAGVRVLYEEARALFAPLVEDRPLEAELRVTVARIERREWSLA